MLTLRRHFDDDGWKFISVTFPAAVSWSPRGELTWVYFYQFNQRQPNGGRFFLDISLHRFVASNAENKTKCYRQREAWFVCIRRLKFDCIEFEAINYWAYILVQLFPYRRMLSKQDFSNSDNTGACSNWPLDIITATTSIFPRTSLR